MIADEDRSVMIRLIGRSTSMGLPLSPGSLTDKYLGMTAEEKIAAQVALDSSSEVFGAFIQSLIGV